MVRNKIQKTPQKMSKPTYRFRECSTSTEDMVSSESEAEDNSISDSLELWQNQADTTRASCTQRDQSYCCVKTEKMQK